MLSSDISKAEYFLGPFWERGWAESTHSELSFAYFGFSVAQEMAEFYSEPNFVPLFELSN